MNVRDEGDILERESLGLGHKNGERRRAIGWEKKERRESDKNAPKSDLSSV